MPYAGTAGHRRRQSSGRLSRLAVAALGLTAAGLAASITGLALWMLSTTQYSALAGRRAGHLLAGRPGAVRVLTVFVAIVSLVALVTTLVR